MDLLARQGGNTRILEDPLPPGALGQWKGLPVPNSMKTNSMKTNSVKTNSIRINSIRINPIPVPGSVAWTAVHVSPTPASAERLLISLSRD